MKSNLKILIVDQAEADQTPIAQLEKFDIVLAQVSCGRYRQMKNGWTRNPGGLIKQEDVQKALELLGVESAT